jgi:phosphorylcholine metabolism protein LicD
MTIAKLYAADTADTTSVHLTPKYLEKLNKLLKNVIDFIEEYKLEYWADGGTLLGAVRNKKHIPWDDDEDLGMSTYDFFQFRKHAKELETRYNYIVEDTKDEIIKIFDPSAAYIRDKNKDYPRTACVDIFHYTYLKKDKKYILSLPRIRSLYPNCEHHMKDLYPLKEYEYGDLKIKGAQNPEQFLTLYYGNWKEQIIYIYM